MPKLDLTMGGPSGSAGTQVFLAGVGHAGRDRVLDQLRRDCGTCKSNSRWHRKQQRIASFIRASTDSLRCQPFSSRRWPFLLRCHGLRICPDGQWFSWLESRAETVCDNFLGSRYDLQPELESVLVYIHRHRSSSQQLPLHSASR